MRLKLQNKTEWNDMFVLFPRKIGRVLVWLEFVERKLVLEEYGFRDIGWVWKYRLKGKNGET